MECVNSQDRLKNNPEKLSFNCEKFNDEYNDQYQVIFINTNGNVAVKLTYGMNDLMENKIGTKETFLNMEKMMINFIFYSPPKEV